MTQAERLEALEDSVARLVAAIGLADPVAAAVFMANEADEPSDEVSDDGEA